MRPSMFWGNQNGQGIAKDFIVQSMYNLSMKHEQSILGVQYVLGYWGNINPTHSLFGMDGITHSFRL